MRLLGWLMGNKHRFVMLSPSKPWCVMCGSTYEGNPEHF